MTDPMPAAALRGAVDLSSLRSRSTAPAAPSTNAGPPSPVIDVGDAAFPQVLEISRTVPVIVALWASWSAPSVDVVAVLERLVLEHKGALLLAKVDAERNPQIVQAFRAPSVPLVTALIAGQPVPLLDGPVPEEQLRDVLSQLLTLAAQNGVTGSMPVASDDDAPAEPAPLPPLHQAAFDAIEAGDFEGAIVAYEKALAENPRDEDARAGLGQVRLLHRVQQLDAGSVRAAAAGDPHDVAAHLAVADLDAAGGHIDDAFGRLLDLFAGIGTDERAEVRARLVELFALVGDADPRVIRARGRLTSLLF